MNKKGEEVWGQNEKMEKYFEPLGRPKVTNTAIT